MSAPARRAAARLPRIGPCRDPLRLLFLEFKEDGGIFRRYFADRAEARAALKAWRAAHPSARRRATDARVV